MRKRRGSDDGAMISHGFRDAESAGWHDAPPPMTAWGVTRILMWVGLVALLGTVLLNVSEVVRAKTHEVYSARAVAGEELAQQCCRMLVGADVGKKAAASCSAILSQEKATSHDRLHRCERATQILSHTVVIEVAAAVWRHFVPFGNFSVLEVVAQLGINSFSTYLGHYALRRVIPV
jgi:hypothetical protein